MDTIKSKPTFYNYIILDPRKRGRYSYDNLNFSLLYEPMYVGKGKRCVYMSGMRYDRKNQHLQPSRQSKGLIYNKIKHLLLEFDKYELRSYIIEFNTGELEPNTLLKEQVLIGEMGRMDMSTGILCNHTDGGEGGNGVIPPTKGITFEEFHGVDRAKEIKEKMSKATSGQLNGASSTNMPEHLRKDKGKRSYETRKRNGQIKTGQQHNFSKTALGVGGMADKTERQMKTRRKNGELEKTVALMQETKKKDAKKYVLTSPDGEEYSIHFNLYPFCKEHNLSYDTIWRRIKDSKFGVIQAKNTKSWAMKNTVGWVITPV